MTVNNVSEKTKASLKTRIITAAVLAIVAVPGIIFGSWTCFLVILLIGIGSVFEFTKAPGKKYPIVVYIIALLGFLSFGFWVFARDVTSIDISSFINNIQMTDIYISTLGIVVYICALFLVHLASEKVDVKDIAYLFMMTVFVALGLQSTLFLRYCPTVLYNNVIAPGSDFKYNFFLLEALLIYYVIGTTLLCDTFAYFTGILFGRHKMNPRISPKKTWEGFVGGVVLSSIVSIAFVFICDALGAPVLKGILDIEHWYYVIVLTPLIAVVGVLGDLMFSSIKRYFGVKDFGKILAGHGGLLDRFDSVLMAVFVFSTIIVFLAHDPFGIGL